MGVRGTIPLGGPVLQCELCPKACRIPPGYRGECRIRANLDGELKALTYGLPVAIHVDPVEKKPLNHFRPGQRILSVATAGCNLHCRNCQNWTISQVNPEDADNTYLPPDEIVALCRRTASPMVAFTYSEPIVFYEYTLDGSRRAREAGLDTVLVSAGYGNPGPLRRLFAVTSAANIDLKAYSDRFYREVCDATLRPVLDALVLAKEAGVWLEVTNLIIPTLNDSDTMIRDLVRWVRTELGTDTPLHFSRFVPHHRLKNLPPTPAETLYRAAQIAEAEGLHYVYVGNVFGNPYQHTFCPKCRTRLVARRGYVILENRLAETGGRCPKCNTEIAGVWKT